jgi:hypothetical protein
MTVKLQEKRHFLEVFNVITSKGEKQEDGYEYKGIRAWHDFDGYTCWLAYKDLTITMFFHNKYEVDFDKQETFSLFTKKVNQILFKA